MDNIDINFYNNLSNQQIEFLQNLEKNINLKLNFHGSVIRKDFFKNNKSDIDIDIFYSNKKETLSKILNYLSIPKTQIKYYIWKTYKPEYLTFKSIKITYINTFIKLDIKLYNKKFYNNLSIFRKWQINKLNLLENVYIIIKYIYYNLKLINTHTFIILKTKLYNIFNTNEYYILFK